MNSGIPLGGIGAGTVEIRDDGLFREWQPFGNWRGDELRYGIENAFFAVCARAKGSQPVSRVLATEPRAGLPPVAGIDYRGEFPFAALDYECEDLPCRVRLTAFSPFIPHDEKNSALPAAVFRFEVTNTGVVPCEVAVAACLENVIGHTCPAARTVSRSAGGDNWRGVEMACNDVPDGVPSAGTMVLRALGAGAVVNAGGEAASVIAPFVGLDAVEETGSAAGSPEQPKMAAVSCSRTLGPGETAEITFFLTWHFPCFTDAEGIDIGRMYANWFGSASEVADYLVSSLNELERRTRLFRDVFYRSNLPGWLIDAVNAQLTTLFKTSWWTKDGTFAIWEGMGCCGAQTADVAYYGSFPVVMLFPELAKQAMRLTARFQNPSGRIPHFFPGTFQYPDAYHMIDVMPKFALMAWRDYLWTGDRAYLDEMWPHVHAAMEHNRALDRNGDFVCDSHGIDQTYDGWEFEGASIYVGLINAVGFRAAAAIARLQGEENLAAQYERLAVVGAASLDRMLWNGEYYDLYYDITTSERDRCCMADQMNGAWYARILELGEFLPGERVRTALDSVYRCNRGPDCVYNGTWPILRHAQDDGAQAQDDCVKPPEQGGQWSAIWSGTEYMLASHMVYEGMSDQGLEIAKTVYDRYAKLGRNWDHWECGDHYYRAMVVMTVLFAAQGFHYSAVERRLVVDPRVNRQNHISPLITPGGWGEITFVQHASGTSLRLEVLSGEVALSTVEVGTASGGRAAVELKPERRMREGDVLEIALDVNGRPVSGS